MTERRRFAVWIGDRLAGSVESNDGNVLHFVYEAEYLEDPAATPLSMSMPLARASHPAATVTAYFEALLPERGAHREQLALQAGVSRTNILGLLAHVGYDLPGAVSILDPAAPLLAPGGVTAITDAQLASLIAELRNSAASGRASVSENGQWSLAGAQSKTALTFRDGQWAVPFGSETTTHILKPAVPGFEVLDAHEVVCMRTARRMGLVAAHAWLQPLVDGTHVAVVERYDRLPAAAAGARRIHQEDLCQALGYPAWQKYEREGGPGIRVVAGLFSRLPESVRARAAARFFDALAFNYAIAGTDAHARNFSLLLAGSDVVLAPLYDLNSALPYTRPWGRRFDSVRKLHSALNLGATDAYTRVSRADWIAVADVLGLDGKQAMSRLDFFVDELPAAVRASMDDVESEAGFEMNLDWTEMLASYRDACQPLH